MNKETKLIIEGQEFELIKYTCEYNDKWYCSKLGIVIEKRVLEKGWNSSTGIKKREETWKGASVMKDERQLETLINLGKYEVDKWEIGIKKKEETSDANQEEDVLQFYRTQLKKAKEGLNNLIELKIIKDLEKGQ